MILTTQKYQVCYIQSSHPGHGRPSLNDCIKGGALSKMDPEASSTLNIKRTITISIHLIILQDIFIADCWKPLKSQERLLMWPWYTVGAQGVFVTWGRCTLCPRDPSSVGAGGMTSNSDCHQNCPCSSWGLEFGQEVRIQRLSRMRSCRKQVNLRPPLVTSAKCMD